MDARDDSSGAPTATARHGRGVILVLAAATIVAAGCSSDRVITTDDAPLATRTTTSTAPAEVLPPPDQLANAFDYAAQPTGRTAYYFISPSKRWACAIVSQAKVGCQSSTGTALPITGAPGRVPNDQGGESAPNAIEVTREGDVQFVSLDPPAYALDPGPAVILPFGKLLIVGGFQCNVQEATGVSCQSVSTGKGFTFSADGYTEQYSALPA